MIYQCASCRELVDAAAALLDDRAAKAGLRCARCEAVTWLPLLPPAGASPPFKAVGREGVRVEPAPKRAQDVDKTPSTLEDNGSREVLQRALGTVTVPPALTTLRQELLGLTSRWDQLEAHRALLQRARAVEGLPWLAGCYRRVLAAKPEDPIALRVQQEIVALALASLPETRPETRRETSSTVKVVVYGVLLLGAAAIIGRTVYQTLRYL